MEIHAQGLERTLLLKPLVVRCPIGGPNGRRSLLIFLGRTEWSKEPFHFSWDVFLMARSLNQGEVLYCFCAHKLGRMSVYTN